MIDQPASSVSVPFSLLSKSQRVWYVELLIGAILADGEISHPEAVYIKEIIHFIKDSDQKDELLGRISTKNAPPVNKPPGVPPKILATIFVELCLVLISDIEFTAEEREFLFQVSESFNFSETYFEQLMLWCEQGLSWKTKQWELVSIKPGEDFSVPVDQLSDDQLYWYSSTLVATIMSDKQLDVSEVGFLKMAIGLLKDPTRQKQLTEIVRSKHAPRLSDPPAMDQSILEKVFFEVMLIISADESLDDDEMEYLSQLSEHCGFSEEKFDELIDWCRKGIGWKKAKNGLIARYELKKPSNAFDIRVFKSENILVSKQAIKNKENDDKFWGEDEEEYTDKSQKPPSAPGKNVLDFPDAPESEPSSESNAITDFNMSCFVCGSTGVVKHFQLKPKSIKSGRNIFGIPVYQVSADGIDFIDYNRCKVTICPNCFFASTQKQMFRQTHKAKVPPLIAKEGFITSWIKERANRNQVFKKYQGDFSTINRSLEFVILSYKTAIETSEELAGVNKSDELQWHAVTLRLTLAEILMSNGHEKDAISWLKKIHKRSVEIFKTTKKRFLKYRSGRLIFLLAVYFGSHEAADRYFNYFAKIKETQFQNLAEPDQNLFSKIFGEMKSVFDAQGKYSKKRLAGFMLAD